MVSAISRSIWTALINLRQCRNIKALDSTMFLGLKVVLTLIYKGFRGPLLSFDAPFILELLINRAKRVKTSFSSTEDWVSRENIVVGPR